MEWHALEARDAFVNGIRIHYRIGGTGKPLVLLHGSPQTSLSWRKLVPLLPTDRTIVAPDLRGYGRSDKPELGYGILIMAKDVRQLVEELELGAVDLVGHDLGGIVAYAYAAQHMSDVRRLGVMEAPILGVPSPTLDTILANYWHFGLYAHPRLPELLIAGRERAYLTEFFQTYGDIGAIETEALVEYAHHLASPGGIRGLVGVYREVESELPTLARLTENKLTMPVWAVGGDRSMGMGPYEQFQHLADQVCGGVIHESGHWIIEEQPSQVAKALNSFLR
ncbi:alpha/beta hydrolase [Mesorhizobium sp. SB112]|uniref:alpha/beta fold hydrolase n=1 Tax=Mesorhizobium sp. SB112 TaxID=3151853 RepID=UPI003264C62B